jgi:hypothetical protein
VLFIAAHTTTSYSKKSPSPCSYTISTRAYIEDGLGLDTTANFAEMFLKRSIPQHVTLMDKLQLWARSEETHNTIITSAFSNDEFEFIFKHMIPSDVTTWSVDVLTHKSYNCTPWSPDLISNEAEKKHDDGDSSSVTTTILAKCFIYIYTPFPFEFNMAAEPVSQINIGNSAPLVGTSEIQCFVAYASTDDIAIPHAAVRDKVDAASQGKRGLELTHSAPGYVSSVQIEPFKRTASLFTDLSTELLKRLSFYL